MVLDAGRIVRYSLLLLISAFETNEFPKVEFDSPKELLGIEDGKLRALVDQSGDKDVLYTMAGL